MAIKVEQSHIRLSVRDLLLPAAHPQMLSSFPLPQRGLLGRQAQEKVQTQKNRRFGLFHSERHVSHSYDFMGYTFTVQGRIDGLYELKNRVEIEEIKSVILNAAEWKKLRPALYPHFMEQVLFYAYLLQDELKGVEIKTYLILINLINDARRTFTIPYKRPQVELLLQQRFTRIIQHIRQEAAALEEKKRALASIDFSLPESRPQQQDMMNAVRDAFESAGHLLISAPTGTGKTAAALIPAIRFAYLNNKRIFFVTSKTSQQNIVHETVLPLLEQGLELKTLFLRASEKMCAHSVYFCHEAFCPYANNYRERLDQSNLVAELLDETLLTPELIFEKGRALTLCPFEVSLDVSLHCDLVVGDYNYVFDPGVYLRRLFQRRDYSDWLLIIDEAHNLYDRGMAYLSPEIKQHTIRALLEQAEGKKNKVYEGMAKGLRALSNLFEKLDLEGVTEHETQQYFTTQLHVQAWQDAFDLYEAAFIKYLIYKVRRKIIRMEDPFEDLYYRARRFVQVARIRDEAFVPFYNAAEEGILKIQCCDPSHYLSQRLEGFHSAIAMSATLDPLPFYRDVLGFESLDAGVLALDSPFPASNRKVIIVPGISTRYKDRMQNYPKIAQIIEDVVAQKAGNYLAFFPSYEFMQNVNLFLGRVKSEKIMQTPGMAEAERDDILNRLRQAGKAHLLLAVMGGVFSEGVDYHGRMADGVFVVSPALPKISFERELLRAYYEHKRESGMQYAYIFPGMNKVIQAVGRLIRAASDKGVVLLIGERFSDELFMDLLPAYWFKQSGNVVVSKAYLTEVKKFWQNN